MAGLIPVNAALLKACSSVGSSKTFNRRSCEDPVVVAGLTARFLARPTSSDFGKGEGVEAADPVGVGAL